MIVPVVALALALAGCASTVDMLPERVGGLPAGAPARPAEPLEYPSVYGATAPRESRMLNVDEQKSMEKELTDLRDRQIQRANAPAPPEPAKEVAPPKKQAPKQATKVPPKKGAAKQTAKGADGKSQN